MAEYSKSLISSPVNKPGLALNSRSAQKIFRAAILTAFLLIVPAATLFAQRFAYIDSEYILSSIPEYRSAQEQLDRLAEKWQTEIEQLYQDIESLYREYQNNRVLMSDDMRRKREEEIVSMEKRATDLQQRYFGPQGELYQNQEELVRPIQDRVYKAIEQVADQGNYAVIFDTAAAATLIYANPRNDVSDDVLKILGYSN